MVITKTLAGKILYALLFCAVFPLWLIWWASRLDLTLAIDPSWYWLGVMITVIGSLLVLEAFWRLWHDGKGLPMNAFPPSTFVKTGSYRLFHHPIYVGFSIGCAGVSIILFSAAGLFVITPVVILLCTALVTGYENLYLRGKFGSSRHQTFFGLRTDMNRAISVVDRLGVFCSTFILWIVVYKVVLHLGTGAGYINTMLLFETNIPVVESFEIPYAFTYLFVGIIPFVLATPEQLRKFQLTAGWVIGVGFFLQLTLPFYSTPRSFVPASWLGEMILVERKYDGIAAAFPSFHALWGFVSAMMLSERFPKLKWFWIAFSLLIAISCVAVGVHSIADVVAAIAVFGLIVRRRSILENLSRSSEKLANSWREWHLGRFRIINHSLYAGLAAFVGVMIAGQFAISVPVIIIATISSLVGGALWGQFIEGSNILLRPFGYYGAILGGILGLVVGDLLLDESIMLHFAAIAVASPWVHAVGRLRCLVQGCCHGRPCEARHGIVYINSHSRVTQSKLGGSPVYNTQLISIGCNILIGIVLWRLWYAEMDTAFLTGTYFILSGAARFVEEAYRGEPQTKIINGLRIYQWLAILSILAGMAITSLGSDEKLIFQRSLDAELVGQSLAVAACWAFAMGMDFPKSNIRFSRLSG
jgi:protein-S-isoprenylcysteine O-methyltransferase Ste14